VLAIGLRFPAGRFHTTPWGRHVNEGVPEWPPSPWRLLRCLVATWKTKATDLDEPQVETVLEQLLAPPLFILPPATAAHTRHYMRWYKKGPDDQTLVFDSFVCLDRRREVAVIWPDAQLGKGQRATLRRLLTNINYLGRAESWCEARLLDSGTDEPNARPLDGQPYGKNQELVRVLCADPDQAFDNTHVTPRAGSGGRRKSKRPHYDPAWHLCIETAQLHDEKWSDPPGSKWVTYVRPADCFDPPPKPRSRPCRRSQRFQIARYALDSTVLPLVTETLPVAESARRIVMGVYGRRFPAPDGSGGRSPVFSGKGADNQPLQDHGHAYYLPTDEDNDGRLDHLTIVAADGFDEKELKTLDRLRALKSREREQSGHHLRVLLLGLGRLDDYQPLPLRNSQVWVSATPFIAPRHLKKRGTKRDPRELWDCPPKFLSALLREELARLLDRRTDLCELSLEEIKIEPVVDEHGVFRSGRHGLRPIQFKRFRRKQSDDGGRRPAGFFRMEFGQSISGPIALGHSCHFGLGLFVPAQDVQ